MNLSWEAALAANGHTNATGNWNNPSTWLFAGVPRVPTCGDTVNIDTLLTVTVNSQENLTACASPLIIYVRGTLQFTNGNKLSLPCGSVVYVLPGGLIKKATSGGGNSTFIEICNITYWTAGDGDLFGPDTLGAGSLPIELLSFDAQPADNKVDVSWTTVTEINNNYFTVEKSADATDFVSIGTVQGAGNSTATLNYSFADYSPVHGISYYRLRQTDFDGQFSYSQIVMVNYSGEYSFSIVAAFVNESSSLNLFFTDDLKEKCRMEVYDVLGKSIFGSPVESAKGMNKKQIEIPELMPGIYFVTLTNGKTSVSRRFVR
ncbi:MAG: T9SS type A sorting domain-containing protein [Bacteroidia bacterium]|nr:T9SS type A sorting domain-containing protein [Bacteroidia bacterium]